MICVDASVAVKWILEEERSDRADALYAADQRLIRHVTNSLPFVRWIGDHPLTGV